MCARRLYQFIATIDGNNSSNSNVPLVVLIRGFAVFRGSLRANRKHATHETDEGLNWTNYETESIKRQARCYGLRPILSSSRAYRGSSRTTSFIGSTLSWRMETSPVSTSFSYQ